MSKNKSGRSKQFPSASSSPAAQSQSFTSKALDVSPHANQNSMTSFSPEAISLQAYDQVKRYLATHQLQHFSVEDLNAVLRLSQHLRVFGLLSAVGYINQSNEQEGKTRQRTVPVWCSLLGDFLGKPTRSENAQQRRELMNFVQSMAKDRPKEYWMQWRQSMEIAQRWNFWARAHKDPKGDDANS